MGRKRGRVKLRLAPSLPLLLSCLNWRSGSCQDSLQASWLDKESSALRTGDACAWPWLRQTGAAARSPGPGALRLDFLLLSPSQLFLSLRSSHSLSLSHTLPPRSLSFLHPSSAFFNSSIFVFIFVTIISHSVDISPSSTRSYTRQTLPSRLSCVPFALHRGESFAIIR